MPSHPTTPYIAVIDPALHTPELDCFNVMARRAALPMTYHLPGLHGVDSLVRDGPNLAGVVVLGSGASVHDERPWLGSLAAWLEPKCRAGVPTLGLCFGHQFLAHLFGGSVGMLWGGTKKRGLRRTQVDAPRLLPAEEGPLIVSHREAVIRPPVGWKTIAASQAVPYDGLAHPDLPIWGFQAHPEATAGFLANNGIEAKKPESAFEFGHRIVGAFLDLAAKNSGCR